MIRKTLTLTALTVALLACRAQAQLHETPTLPPDPAPQASDLTIDQLVAKYEAARGGEAKIKAIHTVKMTGEWSSNTGSATPVLVQVAAGRWMRRIAQGSDIKMANVVDGAKTWEMNARNGITKPTPMSAADGTRFRRIADPQGPLVDAAAKGDKLEVAGRTTWRGAPVYKLKVTYKDGGASDFYLDGKTFLLTRVVSYQFVPQLNKTIAAETAYQDFRDVDGIKYPFSEKVSVPEANFSQSITWSKVEINVPLDEAAFKGPA
jgi:hypothetical protein